MKLKACWHFYHDKLLEFATESDISDRLNFIVQEKPKNEVPLRLGLLHMVQGQLPVELIEARYTDKECAKALGEWQEFMGTKLFEKLYASRSAAGIAWGEVLVKYKPQIDRLHKLECPDCPWNGETIFSE